MTRPFTASEMRETAKKIERGEPYGTEAAQMLRQAADAMEGKKAPERKRCPDCKPNDPGTRTIYDPSPAGGPDWIDVECSTCKGSGFLGHAG